MTTMRPSCRLLLLLGASWAVLLGCEGRKREFASSTDCEGECTGDRDSACAQTTRNPLTAKYTCQCLAGYFSRAEEDLCEAECGDANWSLFTYGTCFRSSAVNGECQFRCGSRIRVWTTVFIFVLFTAAVVTLVFMLPLLLSSCLACATVRKDRKQRKKIQVIKQASKQGRESRAQSQIGYPPHSEYDVATIRSTAGSTQPIYGYAQPVASNAVVPVHSGAANGTASRNYWSHYYYQTKERRVDIEDGPSAFEASPREDEPSSDI